MSTIQTNIYKYIVVLISLLTSWTSFCEKLATRLTSGSIAHIFSQVDNSPCVAPWGDPSACGNGTNLIGSTIISRHTNEIFSNSVYNSYLVQHALFITSAWHIKQIPSKSNWSFLYLRSNSKGPFSDNRRVRRSTLPLCDLLLISPFITTRTPTYVNLTR